MEIDATIIVLLLSFSAALIMGFAANKTNFCTMGAVSDWINMGDTGRIGAWMLAISVAIAGVVLMQYFYGISFDSTLPPYKTANFAWLRYVLGGLLFGVGMTLASGCGNKTMVNIGGGNLKSLMVLLITGATAYLLTKTELYEIIFHSWINSTAIDLSLYQIKNQSLDSIILSFFNFNDVDIIRLITGLSVAFIFLFIALKSKDLLNTKHNILGGIIIGLMVVAGWFISGGSLGQQAIEAAEWMDVVPVGVGVQSYTFINPMGEMLNYAASPFDFSLITFGVVAIFGVISGSFIASIFSKQFRFIWFYNIEDAIKHISGAVLMGTGGVLGMGCTIGQGITGVSTLSLGSLLVLGSIITGSALTIKVTSYRIMYEDSTLIDALLCSLVDMNLLTDNFRKYDKV
ncbi:MAG: hypothetical protein DIZ80_07930 [endosymbiont of Galathealinum brachiosum]|uniref:Uncharacterized protein n=1 Tax=endosymbiont of Galathealinum brachiosum TaxID=2200906 RepID=A0A370DGN2_9GAMM|nr:MAG: hypothetical protein DIZ80_07930 [endosymbiont of Galathealinum brachiosum]